eukprot:420581-Amphidinium_carterae.2
MACVGGVSLLLMLLLANLAAGTRCMNIVEKALGFPVTWLLDPRTSTEGLREETQSRLGVSRIFAMLMVYSVPLVWMVQLQELLPLHDIYAYVFDFGQVCKTEMAPHRDKRGRNQWPKASRELTWPSLDICFYLRQGRAGGSRLSGHFVRVARLGHSDCCASDRRFECLRGVASSRDPLSSQSVGWVFNPSPDLTHGSPICLLCRAFSHRRKARHRR